MDGIFHSAEKVWQRCCLVLKMEEGVLYALEQPGTWGALSSWTGS